MPLYDIALTDATSTLNITGGPVYFAPVGSGMVWADDGMSVTFPLLIQGGDPDARVNAATLVQGYFDRASNAESLGIAVTADISMGGSRLGIFDLAGGLLGNPALHNGNALGVYPVTFRFTGPARSAARAVFSGTLTGSSAGFLARSIPGNEPALVHLDFVDGSPAPIVRMHWARVPFGMSLLAASDYTPWVDAVASGDGTDTLTAGALGGSVVTAALSGLGYAEVARITQPAGAWQQGAFDGFLRACGTGTALAAPASLAASVTAATISTVVNSTSHAVTPAASGISGSAAITGNGTTTIARTGATAGGTIILLAMTSLNGNTATITPTATGATFTQLITRSDGTLQLQGWIARNASGTTPLSITQGMGASAGTPSTQFRMVELLNLGSNPQITRLKYTLEVTEPSLQVQTTDTTDQVIAVLGIPDTGTITAYGGGFTPLGSGAWRQVTGINQSVSADIILTGGTWSGFAVALTVPAVTTGADTITYDEPTPGELFPGTYTARVQVIDAARYRSNATNSATATVTIKRSSTMFSWPAVTYAVAYVLTVQAVIAGQPTRYYEVVTTNTDYTLTTLDGLGELANGALPATSGALAPSPAYRVLLGTAGDTTFAPLADVLTDGSGNFRLYRAFGRRPLPPVAPMLDSWQPWVMVIEARSANGAAAMIELDAAWIVPSDTYAMVEVPGGTLAAATTWHIEAHRSGKDIIGWLANGARLRGYGVPLLPPGTAAAWVAFETANGHSFASTGTLAATVYPRFTREGTS